MYFNIFQDHFNTKRSQGNDCQNTIFATTSVIFDAMFIWMMNSKLLWYYLKIIGLSKSLADRVYCQNDFKFVLKRFLLI